MNINDLFVRWVSTFVTSEVEITGKIQDSLTRRVGQKVVVVLETDPKNPYAGLSPDGNSLKLRLNGRVSAPGIEVSALETVVADYFNSQQVEAVLQPSSNFLKMTIKIAGISLEDESAPPPPAPPAPEEEKAPADEAAPLDLSSPSEAAEPAASEPETDPFGKEKTAPPAEEPES